MTDTTTVADDDDLPDFDAPLTLKDWIDIIGDDIDEAVDNLSSTDIDKLCEFLRKKLEDIELPF